MYESFFGLHRRPFLAAPSANRYFAASSIEAARATLARCVERAEGIGLLVGPSGTGKTMLLQVLAEQFKAKCRPALLAGGHLTTRRALLQVILFELGLPYRELEEGELRLALIEHLARNEQGAGGMLLLVDEAHVLPTRLLEEVRMITNLMRQGQPCVHLILAGGPALEHRLASPKLDSLNQRLAARCYLEALDRAETREYVRHQLAACGGRSEDIFDGDAVEAIYRATDGVPRLINQVGDHALMLAYADGQRRLDAGTIERTWADLQQLPAPWVTGASGRSAQKSEVAAAVVEFGSLDGDDELSEPPHEEPACESNRMVEMFVDDHSTNDNIDSHAWVGEIPEQISDLPSAMAESLPPVEATPRVELVWSRDAEALTELDRPEAEPPVPASQHSDLELVIDRYAILDALREPAVPIDAEAPPAWETIDDSHQSKLVGQQTQSVEGMHSPEELLTLAEALLFREMAGLDASRPPEKADDRQVECADPASMAFHVSNEVHPQTSTIAHGISSGEDEANESSTISLHSADYDSRPYVVANAHDEQSPPDTECEPHDARLRLAETIAGAVPVAAGEGDFADASDADLIVIEDDPPPKTITLALPSPAPATATVRKPEFRQLFARMRRGEDA